MQFVKVTLEALIFQRLRTCSLHHARDKHLEFFCLFMREMPTSEGHD